MSLLRDISGFFYQKEERKNAIKNDIQMYYKYVLYFLNSSPLHLRSVN